VYFTRSMNNHHGGVVLVDGYLYGFNDSILTCLEFATGKMMWRDRSVGKGSVTFADGNLYMQSEDNVVGLAEATPSGYRLFRSEELEGIEERPGTIGLERWSEAYRRGPSVTKHSSFPSRRLTGLFGERWYCSDTKPRARTRSTVSPCGGEWRR
jgi:hypothetical protein